ncbi:hypothetical protein [Myroides odoratimimus]|uniref:hypothetical protein n=1 Tax=Myroides odoratimimus TaxID=76832 RepID=UPI00217FBAC3|nr:hypothetical protein [Myroides odoratimimus]MCS7474201.1 hypothetical protein [Myroides odoratimimus]
MTKIKIQFTLIKIKLLVFLGKFIPYFKNKLAMILNEFSEVVKGCLFTFINSSYENSFNIDKVTVVTKDNDASKNQLLDTSTYTIDYLIEDDKKKFFDIRVIYYIKSNRVELKLDLSKYMYENGEYLSKVTNFFDTLNETKNIVFKDILKA